MEILCIKPSIKLIHACLTILEWKYLHASCSYRAQYLTLTTLSLRALNSPRALLHSQNSHSKTFYDPWLSSCEPSLILKDLGTTGGHQSNFEYKVELLSFLFLSPSMLKWFLARNNQNIVITKWSFNGAWTFHPITWTSFLYNLYLFPTSLNDNSESCVFYRSLWSIHNFRRLEAQPRLSCICQPMLTKITK